MIPVPGTKGATAFAPLSAMTGSLTSRAPPARTGSTFCRYCKAGSATTRSDITLAYWKEQKLPAPLVRQLRQGPLYFADEAAWQAWLAELQVSDERHVRMATEGALLGGLSARGVSPDLAVLSDGASLFVVFVHAACWVHAERPLAR